MNLDIKVNFEDLLKGIDEFPIYPIVSRSMKETGMKTEAHIKNTINTFVNEKGHKQGVDSGGFRDSVHMTITDGGYSFTISDGVPYGIWHETGTKSHWVFFFDRRGNLTSFGQWAMRHFSEIGFTAVGKRGKTLKKPSRDLRMEVLRKKRGMKVKLSKMQPFEKGLQNAKKIAPEIFSNTFGDIFAEGFAREIKEL
jgi:hypothetical protein